MKKLLLFVVTTLLFIAPVKAAETEPFYVNSKGTTMTEIEYNNILKLHGEEMLEMIDQETLNDYKDYYSNNTLEIETEYIINSNEFEIVPLAELHDTDYKTLCISSATYGSSTSKLISITLKWKKLPKVRSYDVLGFRLENTNLLNKIKNFVSFDGTSASISGSKNFTNGYGASIKLPSNCSSINITQTFEATTGGKIYASYQHSVRSITLSNSLDFSISSSGIGGVFKFGNNDLFDKMQGVSISV